MRIGVVSIETATRVSSWSGIPFHAASELRRRGHQLYLVETPWLDLVLRRLTFLRRFGVEPRRSRLSAWIGSRLAEAQLRAIKPQVVLAFNAQHKIAYLQGDWPTVLCVGALFGTVISYYPEYRGFGGAAVAAGDAQESAILARANTDVVLSTRWAARTGAAYYGCDEDRFHVIPMGGNLTHVPDWRPEPHEPNPRLLFLGYDWRRKGGPLSLAAFEILRRARPTAELHIVGCVPPEAIGVAGVTVHGPLAKSPTGEGPLETLFRRCAFLLAPSRSEIFGLALCEAAAFGQVVIAADTGGIGAIVAHGESGVLVSASAGPEAYARAVLDLCDDPDRLAAMRAAARNRFETTFNWRAWGDAMEAVLRARAGA